MPPCCRDVGRLLSGGLFAGLDDRAHLDAVLVSRNTARNSLRSSLAARSVRAGRVTPSRTVSFTSITRVTLTGPLTTRHSCHPCHSQRSD